mmetsp:Transcript_2231/g.5064  ORF Transcript_2231/g.5064 Transcript_2231/m.5064 type:complete len:329 (+) Transcript_2231:1334-2320(+)
MWIVRLRKQLHHTWKLLRGVAEHESKCKHSCPPHIVTDVRHRHVQQLANRSIVGRSAIRKADGEAASVAQDGIFVSQQLLNQGVRFLFSTKHDESQGHGARSNNLFVLCVMRVGQQLRNSPLVSRPDHDQSHCVPCGLTCDGVVRVQRLLQFLVHRFVASSHARQAETQTRPMLNHLTVLSVGVLELVQKILLDSGITMICVDQAHGVQCATFRVRRTCATFPREICAQNCPRLFDMPFVNDSQRCCSGKLGPIHSLAKPLEVVSEKNIRSRAALHQRMGKDYGSVCCRVALVHSSLDLIQQEQVSVIVAEKKLQMQLDGRSSRENGR